MPDSYFLTIDYLVIINLLTYMYVMYAGIYLLLS